jgi:hypothetical protein
MYPKFRLVIHAVMGPAPSRAVSLSAKHRHSLSRSVGPWISVPTALLLCHSFHPNQRRDRTLRARKSAGPGKRSTTGKRNERIENDESPTGFVDDALQYKTTVTRLWKDKPSTLLRCRRFQHCCRGGRRAEVERSSSGLDYPSPVSQGNYVFGTLVIDCCFVGFTIFDQSNDKNG